MAKIDWEKTWEEAIKDKELFPIKSINNKTLSISCPTRFSGTGELSIDITPTFNDESIVLELLVFNDNLSIKDLQKQDKKSDQSNSSDTRDDFNKLANRLVQYELSNRIMDRFTIKSDGFESEDEAKSALIDYINNKATESGRMFDDKLDELNDTVNSKKESYENILDAIRENRKTILKKVESILYTHYSWKTSKNEDYQDASMQCLDDNGNLMAVVTIVDRENCIVVDLAKGITAKVGLMQSDEDIENELVSDVDAAQEILADREIDQLKDIVADNTEGEKEDSEDDYLESLSRRLTKLESLYIRKKLHRIR